MKTKLILMVLSVVFTMVSSTSTCSAQSNLKKFGSNWHCYYTGAIQIVKPIALRHEYRNGYTEVFDLSFYLHLKENSFFIEIVDDYGSFPFWRDVYQIGMLAWDDDFNSLTQFSSGETLISGYLSNQGRFEVLAQGDGIIWAGLNYQLIEILAEQNVKEVKIPLRLRRDIGLAYDGDLTTIRLNGEGLREALKCAMDSRE